MNTERIEDNCEQAFSADKDRQIGELPSTMLPSCAAPSFSDLLAVMWSWMTNNPQVSNYI